MAPSKQNKPYGHDVHLKVGQPRKREDPLPGPIQSPELKQPAGSYALFTYVGPRPVVYEVENGRVRNKPSLFYYPKHRNYYQQGDYLKGGKFELRWLKRMFPKADLESDGKPSVWTVAGALLGNEVEEYDLVYKITSIQPTPNQPWSGVIKVEAYVRINDALVHLPQNEHEKVWDAGESSGRLNDAIGLAPTLETMEFLESAIKWEVDLTKEVLVDLSTGAAGKALKSTKIANWLLESKVGKLVAHVMEHIHSKALLDACFAFSQAFVSQLSKDLAKYELEELAGKEKKVAVAPDVDVTNIAFEGSTIGPSGKDSSKFWVPVKKTPEFDFGPAIKAGVVAFVTTLIVTHGLGAPIGKAVAKKITNNKEIREELEKHISGIVTATGKSMWSEAIATAAEKTLKDKTGKSAYDKNLRDELTTRLTKLFTLDVIAGAMKLTVEGLLN